LQIRSECLPKESQIYGWGCANKPRNIPIHTARATETNTTTTTTLSAPPLPRCLWRRSMTCQTNSKRQGPQPMYEPLTAGKRGETQCLDPAAAQKETARHDASSPQPRKTARRDASSPPQLGRKARHNAWSPPNSPEETARHDASSPQPREKRRDTMPRAPRCVEERRDTMPRAPPIAADDGAHSARPVVAEGDAWSNRLRCPWW